MPKKLSYDCSKCPAYCCSYDRIEVTKKDIKRLARHFDVDYETAKKRYTKKGDEDEQVLRHRHDDIFDSVCRFLDQETRQCTIYEARPDVCREYPDGKTCGYYSFLSFEREFQDDPDFIP